MKLADPLGLPGAPQETLRAMHDRMREVEGSAVPTRLVLITDRQGHREQAGYAALVQLGHAPDAQALLSAAAFGPRYGQAGREALAELVAQAETLGLHFYETVLSPSDFERVLAEPSEAEVARLLAASNPTDPRIYAYHPEPRS